MFNLKHNATQQNPTPLHVFCLALRRDCMCTKSRLYLKMHIYVHFSLFYSLSLPLPLSPSLSLSPPLFYVLDPLLVTLSVSGERL